MRESKRKAITKLVVQAKECQSYIEKYGQKSKICSDQQFDLMKFILKSYGAFLPNMSPNSCGFFGPEEWVVDTYKARQSVRKWWKQANDLVAHENHQSYDSDDPEGPSLRLPRMTNLLATYPNDRPLQWIIAPLFLHHCKVFCIVWLVVWFAMTSWCILSFDHICRATALVVFPMLGFGPILMGVYMVYLENKPADQGSKCD